MQIGYLPWHRTDDLSADFGGRPCLDDGEVTLTFDAFGSRVEACAEQLHGAGVARGDVVAVLLPNRVGPVVVMFAAWRLGAAVTFVNPGLTAGEAEHQIADSGARVVVNLDALSPDAGRPTIRLKDLRIHAQDAPAGALPEARTAHDDLALLVYTSGAAGRPKGVMLSHGNLLAVVEPMSRRLRMTAQDHCLLTLPLFRGNTILLSVLMPMLAGARTTVMDACAPAQFLRLAELVRPTYFAGVPALCARLASLPEGLIVDLSSLRMALCEAPLAPELRRRCEERFGLVVVEGYGLTEAAGCSAYSSLDDARKPGTVGPALPGQRLRIVDEEGREAPVGSQGEVQVSGPAVMLGYLGMPEETSGAVVDGWLHTGDVGRLDEDGHLTLVDPLTQRIVSGGDSLRPRQIEQTLHEVEGVLEAAVIGRPDPTLGEVPVAFVALAPGADLTPEVLLDHCRTQLALVEVPVEITVLSEQSQGRAHLV